MVAQLPWAGVLCDTLLAAGLGALLGMAYRVLRFAAGNSKIMCFLCDSVGLAFGAVLYRGAAAGLFSSGVMRWYTLCGALFGCALVQKTFSQPLLCLRRAILWVLAWPFRLLYHKIWNPFVQMMRKAAAQNAQKRKTKRMQTKKSKRKSLPKGQKVLYNSNDSGG